MIKQEYMNKQNGLNEFMFKKHAARLDTGNGAEDIYDRYNLMKHLPNRYVNASCFILAALAELGEVWARFGKWWSVKPENQVNEKEKVPEGIQEEVIDVFHFVTSLALCLGITKEELMAKIYDAKNEENYARQKRGY